MRRGAEVTSRLAIRIFLTKPTPQKKTEDIAAFGLL
jgi:hypothetical protein